VSEFIVSSAREGGRFWTRPARRGWLVTVSLPNLSACAEIDVFVYDGEHTLALLFRRLAED
jgi:hypothetical protein